ncbi:alanine aminotransferase 2 isoform X2 [Exaiptasia diaphana]|uniref:alanine transaminase n=1 Tax=Exaiptasia diaphana TaxID=2652724 RepID=A0A913XAH8_EXADI|nr:alanine aminotransferase 2 isoform X2 [Exaiptasia diaphana]
MSGYHQSNGSQNGSLSSSKVLTGGTMNPFIKQIEYAVRGAIVIRASELEKELEKGEKKPYEHVVKANIGDAHALGMKPLTFPRQVLSICAYPELLNDSKFPEDAKDRARRFLYGTRGFSMGAYSDSAGVEVIRQDVAKYIEERDGYPADINNIYLTSGASEGIRSILKLLQTSENTGNGRAGVMIPIPQYPLYSATLSELNSYQINYYLDEDNNWGLDIDELKRAIDAARPHCQPRALCVINPGNPTGQVLSYENIQQIIQFCKEEKLFILADEVYQANIYAEDAKFHSFKKVLRDMGPEYEDMELVSFHSTSKGFLGECGFRGGYMEAIGLDPEVKFHLNKMLSAKLCASVIGQAMMGCLVNPPRPGETSYENFMKEKTAVLASFKERAKLVQETFNSVEGFHCNEVMGAMYSFPRFELPHKAIVEAKSHGLQPDAFYAMELLEQTGLCVVPGSGFGQREGTFHIRLTILPPIEELKPLFERFKAFHHSFLEKYS